MYGPFRDLISTYICQSSSKCDAIDYPFGGFDYDAGGMDQPWQTRKDLEDYNADNLAKGFVRNARGWAKWYGGKELMITQGGRAACSTSLLFAFVLTPNV